MKPAPFAYVRPGTTQDTLAELRGDGAKVLAGGQSLVPVLAMRLGRPSLLVDVNAVPELRQVTRRDGHLAVGATARQRQVQYDDAAGAVPLLLMALPWVGHREIRSRGTVCGSIAHADPAAELPAVASCLDATMVVASAEGSREVPAQEFFTGAMSTTVRADELLTEVRFPVAVEGDGHGFGEFARRHGDYALAGVVVRVRTTTSGPEARISCFGVSDKPETREVSPQLRSALDATGTDPDEPQLRHALGGAAAQIADDVVRTGGDGHASAAYRRQLLGGLVAQHLARAYLKSVRPLRKEGSS